MLIDPVSFLITRRRAQQAGLSSSEAFKASLIGSAIGGSNPGLGIFVADRTIKKKAEQQIAGPIATPVDCVDRFVDDFEEFIVCMKNDEKNAKKTEQMMSAFRELTKNLSTDKSSKAIINKRLEEIHTSISDTDAPVSNSSSG